MRLAPDRTTISRNYGDLAYVIVEIVDQDGRVVPYAEPDISFDVSGAGKLIAVGTANPMSEEPYSGTQRRAWQGRVLAIVQSLGQPGNITLRAHVGGLPEALVQLHAN